jgi:ribosomal protein RSM22 (predicted rRNA methylase)
MHNPARFSNPTGVISPGVLLVAGYTGWQRGGDVPFEDEKYIFVAATRLPVASQPARVLAPPRQSKGRVELKLCQPDGRSEDVLVSKREGDAYRVARRVDWGDGFDPVSS